MTDSTYDGGWGFIVLVISLSLWFKTYMGVLQIGGVALIMLECQYQHGFQQEFKIVFSGCYVQSSHLL